MSPAITTRDLGLQAFAPVHAEMLQLHQAVRRGESAGEVWFVEHQPVFTAGRATATADLEASMPAIERGGQITFHGPGQLVIYPIIPLPSKDVRAWLRSLEALGVAVCGSFGLEAEASVDGTGVFVNKHKVASIGVAIRNWINLHGIAINVDMDLQAFFQVRPCGLNPEIMSDLSRELGQKISMDQAKEATSEHLSLLLPPAEQ